MIKNFAGLVPESLRSESGVVFYSGTEAFSKPSPIYLIGVNPGAGAGLHEEERIGSQIEFVLKNHKVWSSYLDNAWGRNASGHDPMQKRIAHMFASLGIDLRTIPSSNLIFTRSRNVADIANDFDRLVELCWPFHDAVITHLKSKIIICMGNDAGRVFRNKLAAIILVDTFVEDNNRRWKSVAHKNGAGQTVVTVTHPSRANWVNSKSDPTDLIKRLLG